MEQKQLYPPLDALNHLTSCPWRVNEFVLDVAAEVSLCLSDFLFVCLSVFLSIFPSLSVFLSSLALSLALSLSLPILIDPPGVGL